MFTASNGLTITTQPTITDNDGITHQPQGHHIRIIRVLYRHNEHIEAIRFYRAEYSTDLKTAENICDALAECSDITLDPYRV